LNPPKDLTVLKSLVSKIVGLGVAGVVAGALTAPSAGAFAIRNPLTCSGQPRIGLVEGVLGYNLLLAGSCFIGGTSVMFYFVASDRVITQNMNATVTGTVSYEFSGFAPNEYENGFSIFAMEANGDVTNILEIH
jgi:hypothetical protein